MVQVYSLCLYTLEFQRKLHYLSRNWNVRNNKYLMILFKVRIQVCLFLHLFWYDEYLRQTQAGPVDTSPKPIHRPLVQTTTSRPQSISYKTTVKFHVSVNFVNTLKFLFRLIYGVIRVSNLQMNFLILLVKFDFSLLPKTVDGARAEQCLQSLDWFWVLYFPSVS